MRRAGEVISIPYGSIKSECSHARHCLNFISIPYGSIKRLLQTEHQTARIRFQFLMVRLKEHGIHSRQAVGH